MVFLSLFAGACRETVVSSDATLRDISEDSQQRQTFCLDLYSSRSEVLLGEPVRLIVSLTNCSSEVQSQRDMLAPEYGVLAVRVQGPGDRKERLYNPPIRRDGRGTRSVDLAPGESLSAELPLYLDRDGWLLDRDGLYTIRVAYPIGKEYIEASPVELRVASVDDERQLAAAKAFMQPNASRFYFLTGGDEKGEAELRSIADTFPKTVWALYARLAIELNQLLSGDSSSRLSSCQKLYDQTLNTLADIPDIVTAANGYQVVVSCLRDSGLQDAARSAKNQYYEQFPEAPELRTLRLK